VLPVVELLNEQVAMLNEQPQRAIEHSQKLHCGALLWVLKHPRLLLFDASSSLQLHADCSEQDAMIDWDSRVRVARTHSVLRESSSTLQWPTPKLRPKAPAAPARLSGFNTGGVLDADLTGPSLVHRKSVGTPVRLFSFSAASRRDFFCLLGQHAPQATFFTKANPIGTLCRRRDRAGLAVQVPFSGDPGFAQRRSSFY
jgi:hypothetical protein